MYTSLLPLLNEQAKDFTDIWNICFFNNKIFFRAYRRIFVYDRTRIKDFDGNHWSFLSVTSAPLAFETSKGLVRYQAGGWAPAIKHGALPSNAVIRSALSFGKDSVLLATLNHGLYVLHYDSLTSFVTPDIAHVAAQNIYTITLLDKGRMVVSTSLSGCFIMSKTGRFIQRLSKNMVSKTITS